MANKSGVYYKEVIEDIMDKINSKELEVGDKLLSERELCDLYSVSRTTIRKAIDVLVTEGYLNKEAGKGTFVKNNKGLLSNNEQLTGNVLFVRCVHSDNKDNLSNGNDIFYPALLMGIEQSAADNGYHCIYKTIDEKSIDQEEIDQLLAKVEGVIWGGELHNKEFLNHLLDINIPLLLVSPSITVDNVDTVNIEDKKGAIKAVEYLIEKGHQKIVFIAGDANSFPSQQRKEGYLNAMQKAGLESNQLVITAEGWDFDAGYQAMKKVVKKNKEITAIFAASDLLAMGAISQAKEENINIPEDLSIIGFDDVDLARQLKPKLTTLKVMKEEMGRVAGKLLFESILEGRNYSLNVTLPVELIERESVREIL